MVKATCQLPGKLTISTIMLDKPTITVLHLSMLTLKIKVILPAKLGVVRKSRGLPSSTNKLHHNHSHVQRTKKRKAVLEKEGLF